MTIKRNILKCALASIGALSLVACGGGDEKGTQDVGSGGASGGGGAAASQRVFAARVVDGYLAGATVYVDLNENAQLDSFEPRALTDADGFFSYNHRTGVDYCAANASAAQAKYCLRGVVGAAESVLIRATGGYDTITGLPFEGMLSLRSDELAASDRRLVTPVTSMVADQVSTLDSAIQKLVEAGILQPGQSLNDDPYMDNQSRAALRGQIAAIVAKLTAGFAESTAPAAYGDIKPSMWAAAYVEMATLSALQPVDFSVHPFRSGDDVESYIRAVLGLSDSAVAPILPQTLADDFVKPIWTILETGKDLAAAMELRGATRKDIAASQRILEVIAQRAQANPQDPQIDAASAWVKNQLAQNNGLGADLTQLGDEDVDASALVDPAFTFDPASNSVSASAKIPAAAALAFAAINNTSFGLSLNNGDQRGAALLFVSGDSGARNGSLDICVRYSDASGDFNTGSSRDPDGAMLVSGEWSLLNDNTLLLNVDIVGGVRSMLLKSVGVNGLDRDYRFDFGTDFAKWTGSAPSGFTVGNVPNSDATCRMALIEQFGPM